MHGRGLPQVEELRQALGVMAIVLVLRPEDQPELPRVGHQDARGQWPQEVVGMAVAAARLVADLEPIRQPLEQAQHLLDAAHAGALDDLPGLAEHADGDVLGVDVEPDVEHGNLRKSE